MLLGISCNWNVHTLNKISSKNEHQLPWQVCNRMFLKAKHKTFRPFSSNSHMLRTTRSPKAATVKALAVHWCGRHTWACAHGAV